MAIKTPRSRSRLFYGGALGIILIIGLAVGLGVGLGVKHNNGNSNSAQANNAATNSGSTAATPSTVAPLAKWDWTKDKMAGMALGNWLLLERWMNEDAFVSLAGPDAWDEWDFSRILGDRAAPALREHFDSWLNETDVQTMATAGVNHIRVPVPFWALIPTEGNEPYVNAGQMGYVEKLLEWAYKRSMHVLIDLHAMPGNQNGEQQSGRNITSGGGIDFYNTTNQVRADQTLQAAIAFVQNSAYSSVVSGISTVNEPRPYDSQSNLAALRGYYDRSYAALSAANIPMIFHHAFVEGDRRAYWSDFMTGKNPSLLVLEDHPYPGNFPTTDDRDAILAQVCDNARSYQAWPVPVCITEWSLTSGINDYNWMRTFYAAQLSAWNWSAGGHFWAWRTVPSTGNTSPWTNSHIEMYSFVDLMAQSAVVMPPNNGSSDALLASLQQDPQCGPAPTHAFVNPIPAASASPSASASAAPAAASGDSSGGGEGEGSGGDGD